MTGFDTELDALFKSSAGTSATASRPKNQPSVEPNATVSPDSKSSKRKHEKSVAFADKEGAKRRRKDGTERKSNESSGDAIEDDNHRREPKLPKTSTSALANSRTNRKSSTKKLDSESGSESDCDAPPPIHGSLAQKGENGKPRRKKNIPEGETTEQKDARTIFIGNLPASVAKSSARKALHKHVIRCLTTSYPDHPKPKIESSRFRSVAFKTPTSKLPSDTLSPALSKPKPDTPSSEHNRTRAAEWRAAQDPEGAAHKVFQTPAQKKKTAYITGALHESASSSASAYVVFAYPPMEGDEPTWDPVEVAMRAVQACNGSSFMDRTLRVDRVQKMSGEEEGGKADPRTMVFIGNLDFEVDEEAVRALFEKLIEKERGNPDAQKAEPGDEDSSSEDGESEGENRDEEDEEGGGEEGQDDSEASEEDESRPALSGVRTASSATGWVRNVRIIRDKDTQLGKGFGYVQFIDRASVDEILAMAPGTIKLAKRKLRIQRCKTLPGATLQKPKASPRADKANSKPSRKDKSPRKPGHERQRPSAASSIIPTVPRADPGFGERIRSLSKQERKSVKASDVDRVARRLAKKKTKLLSARGARKAEAKSKTSILGSRAGPKSKKPKFGKSGKRERSDKAILKKNVKK